MPSIVRRVFFLARDEIGRGEIGVAGDSLVQKLAASGNLEMFGDRSALTKPVCHGRIEQRDNCWREQMQRTKKRSVIVACLLAVFHLGLGFLYVGRPWPAIAVPVAPFALVFLGRLSGLALMPWGTVACCALIICAWFGSIVWCGIAASRAREAILAPYQRWYVYTGYVLGMWMFVSVSTTHLEWIGARLYRIPAASMNNTLQLGDYVVADSWAYLWGRKPRHGDIAVVTFPAYPDSRYAKRIIGLPGDRVESRQGRVYVNDAQLNEPYLNPNYNIRTAGNWKYTVPENSYFLLGDNRDASEDSRYLGAVPSENIFGRVVTISLSFNPDVGLHFDRVGTVM